MWHFRCDATGKMKDTAIAAQKAAFKQIKMNAKAALKFFGGEI
jgi:hypothetical protein